MKTDFSFNRKKKENKKSFWPASIDIKPFSVYFMIEIKNNFKLVLTESN